VIDSVMMHTDTTKSSTFMHRIMLLVMLSLLGLSGCRPLFLTYVEPDGPPEYQLGWHDGCDTGISAEGNWRMKLLFGFKKRPEMSVSDQYKTGWNEGFTYCRFAYAADK
jgi:hypothetical protein